MKPTIIALVGPTASGKTKTAIEICRELNAEIVSMDSMQIYRGMDIGTAKPTKDELDAAVHHMIDIVEPDAVFTVSMYREAAFRVIDDILSRGKLPLLVGGTGLYLNAISYEMNMGESGADDSIRNELNRIAAQPDGALQLYERLMSIDSESAKKLHPHDTRRVIRALEIYETTGRTKSQQENEEHAEGPYHVLVYGLTLPRTMMYDRINQRVDSMIKKGLIAEVEHLLDLGIRPRKEGGAMQAIGYKEIVNALDGEISMDHAIGLIKQGSRRYAKRQWTWFRHDARTKWFDWTEYKDEKSLIDTLISQIRSDLNA